MSEDPDRRCLSCNYEWHKKNDLKMPARPYFRSKIEQLQALFDDANKDEDLLKSLSHELKHRDRPKAKALLEKVQKELESIGSGQSTTVTLATNNQVPDRVIIECAHCKTNNFVSTLEGVVQHLSCSNCKTSYEAVFKYGVMRTKFEESNAKPGQPFPVGWILLAAVVLLALAVIVK